MPAVRHRYPPAVLPLLLLAGLTWLSPHLLVFLVPESPVNTVLAPVLKGMATPLAVLFLLLAVLVAVARWYRRHLVRRTASAERLAALSWRDFERYTGEVLRRMGYRVAEGEGGRPDGGVDLVAVRGGERYLVQCKHWRQRRLGVRPVRELAGVVAAERAAGGIVAATGDYTDEARLFAAQAGIELLDGQDLLRLAGGRAPVPEGAVGRAAVASPSPTPGQRLLAHLVFLVLAAVLVVSLVRVLPPVIADIVRGIGAPALEPSPAIRARPGAEPGILDPLQRMPELEGADTERGFPGGIPDEADPDVYVPSEDCREYRSHEHMVACVNEHIRARREREAMEQAP